MQEIKNICILLLGMVHTIPKKTPKKILRGFFGDLWLAGLQPVRNTRAVLSMVSASDVILVLKGA